MPIVFLESERLWFRPPEIDDAALLAVWINDPRIRKFLDTRVFPLNQESEREWVKRVTSPPSKGVSQDVVLLFGVKGAAEPMGSTGFHGINWVARQAEWGILIGDPTNWNQGYGREVARRMLRYAFEERNLNRVMLRVNVGNARGVKAYEAAGFVREGILRQAALGDGKLEDLLVMSVLREEWHP